MEKMTMKELLKKYWIVVVCGVVALILIVAIAIVASNNAEKPFKTSDNDDTLSSQLDSEKLKITSAFDMRFLFLRSKYKIEKIALLGQGDFAVVILTLDYVEYRAIMAKEDGEWTVMDVPAIILYYYDYLTIPEEIVRAANNVRVSSDE